MDIILITTLSIMIFALFLVYFWIVWIPKIFKIKFDNNKDAISKEPTNTNK